MYLPVSSFSSPKEALYLRFFLNNPSIFVVIFSINEVKKFNETQSRISNNKIDLIIIIIWLSMMSMFDGKMIMIMMMIMATTWSIVIENPKSEMMMIMMKRYIFFSHYKRVFLLFEIETHTHTFHNNNHHDDSMIEI